jgi:hypothetical protein
MLWAIACQTPEDARLKQKQILLEAKQIVKQKSLLRPKTILKRKTLLRAKSKSPTP